MKPIILDNYVIEDMFDHNGLLCVVILTKLGHRCGYVGVNGECEENKEYYEYLNIHGGITWNAINTKGYPIKTGTPIRFLGFDCAHVGDKPDIKAYYSYFKKHLDVFYINEKGTVRSKKYVANECRVLADQINKYNI